MLSISRSFCTLACVVLVGASWSLVGCGGVKEETIVVPQTAALDEAKQILKNYANGAPMTSEAASFPDLVTRVKVVDAEKGATLEEGLNRIQAQPNNRAAIARELLQKL
jgi:hypothetical protein